jgi:hypothetical protein
MSRGTRIDATPQRVWQVLTDSAYPELNQARKRRAEQPQRQTVPRAG